VVGAWMLVSWGVDGMGQWQTVQCLVGGWKGTWKLGLLVVFQKVTGGREGCATRHATRCVQSGGPNASPPQSPAGEQRSSRCPDKKLGVHELPSFFSLHSAKREELDRIAAG
jgi:hypothetical protein